MPSFLRMLMRSRFCLLPVIIVRAPALEMAGDPHGPAQGLGVLHAPVGVLDMAAPGDDAVVEHKYAHVVDAGLAHDVRHCWSAGRLVGRHADLAQERVGFGNAVQTGGRTPATAKAVASGGWAWAQALARGWRFMMARWVGHSLVRGDRPANCLPSMSTRHHVFGFHEAFGNEGRRAENQVVAHPDGEVPAVAVGIGPLPHAPAQIDDPLLQLIDRGRVKEIQDFLAGGGITSRRPSEFVIGQFRRLRFRRASAGSGS